MLSHFIGRRFLAVLAAATILAVTAAANWPCFRGPTGSGVSADKGLPTEWSATQNVVWKTPMPGFGASSPIVFDGKIYLTCYSGYGLNADEPGDLADLKRHLLCVDLASGRILWDKAEKADGPEQVYKGFIALHGYASSTPATDGQAIYVFHGKSGVYAYKVSGELLWRTPVGSQTHGWGSATSPVLCKNLVIVNASVESGKLVALDKATGKKVWEAGDIDSSWSTPALVDLPGGKQELAVSMKGKALGFDPANGKKLWECESVPDYVCPAVLAHKGVVYVTGGRKPVTVAIRAGGRGDVTKTHRLWELKKASKVPTPLYDQGLLYWVDNSGKALCVTADKGDVVYEERLSLSGGGDKVYASAVLGDGKIYAVSRQGGAVVLAAGKEFKLLATNDLDDKSVFNATPAIVNGRLLLRSDRFLYCLGK